MLYEFKGYRPVVDASSFVHPQAAVTGNVIIGKRVYIGPGAAIRGDWGQIIIEDGCNVQENCTIHLFPGATVRLQEGAHIGHGAIVHGATIGRNCLIGMNSVIMDNVVLGEECIVGALTFVKAGEEIPARSVVVGNPGKIVKQVSPEMLQWKTEGTAIYQALPRDMQESWKACEPLLPGEEQEREAEDREKQPRKVGNGLEYRPWTEAKEEANPNEVNEPALEYGRREFTIEEYLEMEASSTQKHEYYQGEIFAMSRTKVDHNRIVVNLTMALGTKLKGSPCEVFISEQRVHVKANTLFTYPDLSIVCGEPDFYKNDEFNLLNPAVIIEVLSPSTKNYDRGEKFKLYKGLPSLTEYLVFDSRSVLVEQFVKDEKGNWSLRKYDQLSDEFVVETTGSPLTLEEIYRRTQFSKLPH